MCDILDNSSLLFTALRYGCDGNWASFSLNRELYPATLS